jgi:hypothetical protein
MPDDPLLDRLTTDLAPVRPRRAATDLLVLGAIAVVELGLYALAGASRPDIAAAAGLASFWWKLISLGALAVVGAITAVRSLSPSTSPRPGLLLIAILVAAIFAAGWAVDAASGAGDHRDLLTRLMWRDGIDCALQVVALSMPMLIALGVLMRRGASTHMTGSAYAAGLTGAAWGAFVFVFGCPHDDAFYVAVWYLAGCLVVAAAGRIILPLIARW